LKNFWTYYSSVIKEFFFRNLFLIFLGKESKKNFWNFYFYICFGNFFSINNSLIEFLRESFLGNLRPDIFTIIYLFLKIYIYWITFLIIFLLKNYLLNFDLYIKLHFKNNFILNLFKFKLKLDQFMDYLSIKINWLKSKILYHRDLVSPKNRKRKLFRKRKARFYKHRNKVRHYFEFFKNDLWGFFTKKKLLHKNNKRGFYTRARFKLNRIKKFRKFSMFFNLNTSQLLNVAYLQSIGIKKNISLKFLKYNSNRRVFWFNWFFIIMSVLLW
jgi:hypothetical protein